MKLCGTYLKWWGVAENVQNFKCLPRTHLVKRSNKIGIFDEVAIFIPLAEIAQSILESKCYKKSGRYLRNNEVPRQMSKGQRWASTTCVTRKED